MTEPQTHSLGPVMVDIAGTELTEHERARLRHPLVGGVILFKRNFTSVAQLQALTAEIHAARQPRLLIAVDHEGGRVQRFRDGFTRLPPMRALGDIYVQDAQRARKLTEQTGWVLAAELRASGVDFSFTPVLDLDYGSSGVIGNRAFHRDPRIVYELAHALMHGLHRAGMAHCGKHFPGHGFVNADSHHEVPVDNRDWQALWHDDIQPYRHLLVELASIMPAHVIYPQLDPMPAGFSRFWLQQVLRDKLGFQGVIFSDDLCMEGASAAGATVTERAQAALAAGCDMVLVCNQPELADELLAHLRVKLDPRSLTRLARMHGHGPVASWTALRESAEYIAAIHAIGGLGLESGNLDLGVPVGEAP